MFSLQSNMERLSSLVNRWLSVRWGEQLGTYIAAEYPRAGGTWLADMLADYLQIPFPKHNLFPLGCRGVIHNHWNYDARFRRAVYMYRDGRDSVVSAFFYCARPIRNGGDPEAIRYVERRYPYLLDPNTDLDDCAALLPRFIEDWIRKPYGSSVSWPVHVADWTTNRPNVVSVSYEELRENTARGLGRVITELTGEDAQPERIAATVEKFTFARQTGREPGRSDVSDAKRKGVVGDWRNHFSREAGQVFDRFCGEVLTGLGYEPDRAWVDRLPPMEELKRERREPVGGRQP